MIAVFDAVAICLVGLAGYPRELTNEKLVTLMTGKIITETRFQGPDNVIAAILRRLLT